MKREPKGWKAPRYIFKLPIAETYFKAEGMSGDDWRAHTLETLKACMTGEREEGSVADAIIEDWQQRQRNSAKGGEQVRAKPTPSPLQVDSKPTPSPLQVHLKSTPAQDEDEDRYENQDKLTTDPDNARTREESVTGTDSRSVGSVEKIGDLVGSVSSGALMAGSRKGQVWDYGTAYLPSFAAANLGDADAERAEKGYKAQLRRIGPDAFRETLATLLAEMDAGERPDKPGAVFMSRLKQCPSRTGGTL